MERVPGIGPPMPARLERLRARDWRNIPHTDLQVPPDGVILVGDNGHGKTNILEAVAYFHLLRSARGARDVDCVRFGADGFHLAVECVVSGETRTAAVGFERATRRKRATRDDAETRPLSEALGSLPSVMVSPEDSVLVSGGPSERRRYLDVVLALTSRSYLAALQRYRGALLRRNAALRDGAQAGDATAVWEETLAETGAVIASERRAWVDRFAPLFAERCAEIGERSAMAVRYASGIPGGDDSPDGLRSALERSRPADERRGVTLVGPHRDDLRLALAERPLATFGSAGQQRTAAFALRVLEATTLRERIGGSPLLLLDDPFIELDPGRSERIARLLIANGAQAILAVPQGSPIPPALDQRPRWGVRDGVVSSSAA